MNEINGKIARLERELAQAYAEAGVPALSAEHPKLPEWWVNGRYGYQTIFNAIAAATRIEGAAIGISVAAFEQAMIAADPQPAPSAEPVAWRVHPFDYGIGLDGVYALTMRLDQVSAWNRKGWSVEPLFTAPPDAEALRKRVAELEVEVERLRKDAERFIECRSSLVFDMNNHGRVLAEMERAGRQTSPAYSAVEQDRARLHGLIEAIDAELAARGE